MTPAQRRVCLRALVASAVAGVVLLSIVFAKTHAITAAWYRVTVIIVAQAPTSDGAARASNAPAAFVTRSLRARGLTARRSVDSRPVVANDGRLNGTYIHEVALTARSMNEGALDSVAGAIRNGSRWRVIDLAQSGEYVPVRNRRGVHLWRLRSSGAARATQSEASIQISGPAATAAYSDYFMFAFIVMLMISFGSLERNNDDPQAFPPGMHPAVIACQTLLLSLLVCWLWICYAGEYTGALFLTIACLGAVSLLWWGYKTRRYWIATWRW